MRKRSSTIKIMTKDTQLHLVMSNKLSKFHKMCINQIKCTLVNTLQIAIVKLKARMVNLQTPMEVEEAKKRSLQGTVSK